jgi:hypothetical protein
MTAIKSAVEIGFSNKANPISQPSFKRRICTCWRPIICGICPSGTWQSLIGESSGNVVPDIYWGYL